MKTLKKSMSVLSAVVLLSLVLVIGIGATSIKNPTVYGANDALPKGLDRTLTPVGFSVRTSPDSGLRAVFVHDNNASSEGYTLKEYGVIAISEENRNSLSVSLNDAGEVIFGDTVSVVTVERNGIKDEANILKEFSDSDKLPNIADGTYFAFETLNYQDDTSKTDKIYFSGYELFEDSEGNPIVVFTDYSTGKDSSAFVSMSYYDICLGMYKAGLLNKRVDKKSVVWNDLVRIGAVTLTAGDDYLCVIDTETDPLTTEVPTDLDGNPFGDTFTLTEVPIVSNKVKDGVLDLTEKIGITYTILRDGTDYVLIYRPEGGKPGLILPEIEAYSDSPMNHQFIGKKWYGQLDGDAAPKGYSSVSAKRPQPLLLNDTFKTGIKTVIIDHGICGAEDDAFFGIEAETYVASEIFKTLSGSPFLNAEGLTTFHIGYSDVTEGVVDLTPMDENVGELKFSKINSIQTVLISSAVSDSAIPFSQGWEDANEKFLFVKESTPKDQVYIPDTYKNGGNVLESMKENAENIIFNTYDKTCSAWETKLYNSSTGKLESALVDSEGNRMKLSNERVAGYISTVGKVYDKSQNWEVKVFGTLDAQSEAMSDTDITINLGDTAVNVSLEASLRCELLAEMGSNPAGKVQRYTKRENFTYCTVNNVAYVADYISIKCVNGTVSATLNTFDEASTYDSSTRTYNKITYTKKSLTLSEIPANSVVKSEAKISSANGFYTDVIYTSAIRDAEPIEFEVTKALTNDDGSGIDSIARNVFVSEDGKTAYLCANGYSGVDPTDGKTKAGAWLLEIVDYDTNNPYVDGKLLLNNLGKCTDASTKAILERDSQGKIGELYHGSGCTGRELYGGRACTGVTESGNYLYAVERYTGAFDINQRLTNIRANGDATKDDGVHGHGVSFLCIIDKTTFKIVKQIPLNNDATSVEINPYDGKLYVMEMTRNWSVFDIDGDNAADPKPLHRFSQYGEFGGDDAEKVAAYALGNDYIEYQRATFWTDGNGNNYMAMSAFSGGATIWNITDIENRIPTREAWIKISVLNNNIGGRHVFDVAASYPYLYITVGGCVSERHSDGSLADGVIRLDVTNPKLLDMSDSSNVNTAKSLAVHAGIPYDFTADRCDEGDPAPSRIIVKDNVLLLNYSDKGVAFFRIGDKGIPVFDKVADFTNGDPQTMKLNPATGGIVIVNGEGAAKTPGLYESQILN